LGGTLPRLDAAVRIVLRAVGPHLHETLPSIAQALEHLQLLAAEHATAPQPCRASVTGLYLPLEVFFGRFGFAGAFVLLCAGDFGRFFPATSGSFRLTCSRSDTSDRGLPFRCGY
jgi:hypothetical protein